MSRSSRFLLPLAALALAPLAGCQKDDGGAAWAMDPIWLEPADADGVHGFQTWTLYSEKWTKKFDERFFVCSVVVELDGAPATPDDGCPGCTQAWDVTPTILESDCADKVVQRDGWLSLARVGIGDVPKKLEDDDPYPKKAHGGYADYGDGEWVQHGWAYPQDLDTKGTVADSDWNGEQPFQLWPAYVWDLSTGKR